ncbi:MAG TPA: ABC transporter ATP-binding protein [Methanocorpusculum sp.]|nr:ABC transporter ATP-binding protein [Methanocorpusculum sp.]
MEPVIELKNISYKYPHGPKALDNVSFKINPGEKIALVGPNGAGKSTLLLMFNGMLKPDSGEILFNGKKVIYNREALRELRRRVGFVFQNPDIQAIAPTVYQDVAFGPVNLGMSRDEVRTVVSDSLNDTGLAGFERRPIHQLSGGEKKRAAMAGILAMNPDILVFDEPTSALDPAGSEDIMELLDEM